MAPAEMARGAHRCRFPPTQQVDALANDSLWPWFTLGLCAAAGRLRGFWWRQHGPMHLLTRLLGPTRFGAPAGERVILEGRPRQQRPVGPGPA